MSYMSIEPLLQVPPRILQPYLFLIENGNLYLWILFIVGLPKSNFIIVIFIIIDQLTKLLLFCLYLILLGLQKLHNSFWIMSSNCMDRTDVKTWGKVAAVYCFSCSNGWRN